MAMAARPRVLRHPMNTFIGWAMQVFAFGLWVLTDPFTVRVQPFSDALTMPAAVSATAFLAVLSLGSYALLVRPTVQICSDRVVLRNPGRDVELPLSAICEIDWGLRHPVFRTPGRRYVGVGAEPTPLPLEIAGPTATAAGVEDRVRRPTLIELLLAAAWLALAGIGVVFTPY